MSNCQKAPRKPRRRLAKAAEDWQRLAKTGKDCCKAIYTTTLYTILLACLPLILQPDLITASLRPSFVSPFDQPISPDYFRFRVNGILHLCWCDWPSLRADVLMMFLLWPMLLMTERHVLGTVGIGRSARFSGSLLHGPICSRAPL